MVNRSTDAADEGPITILAVRVADMPTPAVPSLRRPCVECGSPCWVDPLVLNGTRFVEIMELGPLVTGPAMAVPESYPRRVVCLQCAGIRPIE